MEVYTFSAKTQPCVVKGKRRIVTDTDKHLVVNAVITGAIFAKDLTEAKQTICDSVIKEFSKKRMIIELIINGQKII